MGHSIGKKRLSTKIIKRMIKYVAYLISNRKKRKAFIAYWVKKLNLEQKEQREIYTYLARYYNNLNMDTSILFEDAEVASLPIWQLWLQGEQHAPVLVKKCFESVRRYSQGREIKILTEKELEHYIDLPDYIIAKYRQGIIPRAHFSDIVRICLLEKYGGTWIDATILLTDYIPAEILQQDFFAISISFISSKPQHIFMRNMKLMLFEYWKNENSVITYLFFVLLFKGMLESHLFLKELRDSGLQLDFPYVNVLNQNFIELFDAAMLADIKQKTFIHKLTYYTKYQKKIKKGTFLDVFQNTDMIF